MTILSNTNTDNISKDIYINSIEASNIVSHMTRGTYINHDFVGMIPYSLELIKLLDTGLSTYQSQYNKDVTRSRDIINVKFNQKVKSSNELLKHYWDELDDLETTEMLDAQDVDERPLSDDEEDYRCYLEDNIHYISHTIDDSKWSEISCDDLRKQLYEDGFYIDGVHYVVYKRSSSKSRTGQCLFIREELYEEMISWSRMYLPFVEGAQVDLASLLAYESLVGSSIENTVTIDSSGILLVSDIDSVFPYRANIVSAGEDGYLDSVTDDNAEVSNSLFDGESLLESEYFPEGKSMILLRNHMMKSAAFSANIQLYLKENCPDGVDYDTWKIKDMYGNKIPAKDVQMITTPNSMKYLRFADVIGSENNMWQYWKKLVEQEGNIYGVCMSETESTRGHNDDGDVLQQTSYQMLNSMALDESEVAELSQFELDYIDDLKNNDAAFIRHIEKDINEVNSNRMFVELYEKNNKSINTKMFRDFRKAEIHKHVRHVQRGKIRLVGDYLTLLGNPVELLKHSIGKFDVDVTEPTLEGNESYTTRFEDGEEITGFRNPHTSMANIYIFKNTKNDDIDRYINLSDNILVVNAIREPIQAVLSGADYDSDTLVGFSSSKMLEVAKRTNQMYPVPVNNVASEKKEYHLTKQDQCDLDTTLAMSTKQIGTVVNKAQELMSLYHDRLANGESMVDAAELMKKINVLGILSEISIDMAKKLYDLDINKELQNIDNTVELKDNRPLFFEHISQNRNIKNRIEFYETPMDYLQNVMGDLDKADYRTNVEIISLLEDIDHSKANRRQKKRIEDTISQMQKDVVHINLSNMGNDESSRNERFVEIRDTVDEHIDNIVHLKIKKETMYDMIRRLDDSSYAVRLMNAMYTHHTEVFMSVFKEN